jgi:hypothetical protein
LDWARGVSQIFISTFYVCAWFGSVHPEFQFAGLDWFSGLLRWLLRKQPTEAAINTLMAEGNFLLFQKLPNAIKKSD